MRKRSTKNNDKKIKRRKARGSGEEERKGPLREKIKREEFRTVELRGGGRAIRKRKENRRKVQTDETERKGLLRKNIRER